MTMNRETAQRLLQVNSDFGITNVIRDDWVFLPSRSLADWIAIMADAQRVIAETDPKPEPEPSPVMKRWSVTLGIVERITKTRVVEVEAESEEDAVDLAWDFDGHWGDWIDVESASARAEEIA